MIKKIIIIIFVIFAVAALCFYFFSGGEKRIIKEDGKLKVGIITDIHKCSGYDQDIAPFVSRVDQEKTDFNVSLGDNINFRVGKCSDSYKEDFGWIFENLKTEAPLHWVLGDHDIDSSIETYEFFKQITGNQKTYYSFKKEGFLMIVLDTVMGGDEMRNSCLEDPVCGPLEEEYVRLKNFKKNPNGLAEYLESEKISKADFLKIFTAKEKEFESELENIKKVRSSGRRDVGRVGDEQMDWLKKTLDGYENRRVVLFSDHPLFPFASARKKYDILNGDKVRKLLEKSGKEIVAISGEAHLWHEEKINGIQYYIIDRFSNPEKSFAIFEWDNDGFKLKKYGKQL